ncbi:MAG: GNAT family N-acetyltransferase [Chloroflexi bacterium]|nr:GNAT family N-acetyltransferase [Chloroflexota bacterium]
MNETKSRVTREYPRTVKAGNTTVTLRLMTAADVDGIVTFAKNLPEEDLLFLRTDITDPRVVREWVINMEGGRTVTVIAEANGEIAGYASLHYNNVAWQRHLGEIRILVGRHYRSQGLGRHLADEVNAIARDLGLRKIIAQMSADQKGALAMFERLGFQPEALLQDFVIDRAGHTRDLVITATDLEGFTDRVR